jgi:hypothetical protein
MKDFDAFAAKDLTEANASLAKKKLPPVQPITRDDWDRANGGSGGSSSPSGTPANLSRAFERAGQLTLLSR